MHSNRKASRCNLRSPKSEIFGSICVVGSGSFRLVCQTQQQQLNLSYQNSSYHTVQVVYMYKAETI